MSESVILKTLARDGELSVAVLDTTEIVNEAIRRHGLSAVAAAALGRTMSATVYLCSWLKDAESSLSVSFDGNGAGGKICATGDGALHVRGYVKNPGLVLPPRADGKLDVGGCTGREGTLTVIRDDGSGIPFVGTCPLVSGEIAEDFSAYFLVSEQCPTAVALGVKIGTDGTCLAAGGVFLRPLPGASEETIDYAETAAKGLASLSSLLEEKGAEGVLASLAPGCPSERRTASFACSCTRERAKGLIMPLGLAEAKEILAEEGKISLICHYCNTTYDFDAEEVLSLFGVGGDHGSDNS